jgi:topoisomerase-4 subunit A
MQTVDKGNSFRDVVDSLLGAAGFHTDNGKIADARVFKKTDGLTWLDSAGRTFTLSWSELKDWVGVRAQAGRIVPKGFPRSNSFGPAF